MKTRLAILLILALLTAPAAAQASPKATPAPTQSAEPTPIPTPVPGPHLPGAAEVTQGFTITLPITMIPDPSEPVPDHAWKSANTKLVKVDKDGTIHGLQPGKAAVTLAIKGKDVSTCYVTVQPNEFTRETPLPSEGEGVCVSTKSLRFTKDKLQAEVFIQNNTSHTVTSLGQLQGTLIDWQLDPPVMLAIGVHWEGSLSPGDIGVASFALPLSFLTERYDTIDLRNRRYEAYLTPARDSSGNLVTPNAQPFEGLSAYRPAT